MKAATVIAMTAMFSKVFKRNVPFVIIIIPHILFGNKEE
jgi:hypothetical protein